MQLSKAFVSLALVIASTSAVPLLNKRIAQTIIDAVQPWENACNAAGGGAQCNPIAVNASSALLAAADPCAQQDAGDIMVNTAKTLNNNQAMVTAAQIFIQQPRNSPNSVAVDYCQRAPQNQELNGFFQCQFQGVNEQKFASGQALGGPGTMPFGFTSPVNPLGSCPANPQGPIADGVQLSTLVQSPGTPATSSSSSAPPANSTTASNSTTGAASPNATSTSDAGDTSFPPPQQSGNVPATANMTTPSGTGSVNNAGSNSTANGTSTVGSSPSVGATASANGNTATPPANASNGAGFQLANGQAAQSANAQFAGLNASSPCTEGQNACVQGGFAQCVGGKFAVTQCAGGTSCFALPLVNKPGTSIACTTQSDATSRIAATGATGGITGSS